MVLTSLPHYQLRCSCEDLDILSGQQKLASKDLKVSVTFKDKIPPFLQFPKVEEVGCIVKFDWGGTPVHEVRVPE